MKHPEIPRLAYRLFQWFCKPYLFEELEGDLEETFLRNKERFGLKKARRSYWREVLKMIRPSIVGKPSSGPGYQAALIGSYVTISLRNLKRHKLFSFINIFSLSVAMSSGLLVIGMINDLLKFDEFHEHKHEIYRVIAAPTYQSKALDRSASTPLHLGEEMIRAIPGVQITNLGRRLQGEAQVNDKSLFLKGIYADEHFFDFLSFDLVKGNANDLSDPFNILLSESFVEKVFQNEDPIGAPVDIEGIGTFLVAGVVKDAPMYSHIQYDVIAALSTVHLLSKQGVIEESHDTWESLDRYYNYVYVPEIGQRAEVEQWLTNDAPGFYTDPATFNATFELQPIHQIIPGPNIDDSIGPKMIYLPIIILSIIAGAILLSAIFNYTNLSMARSLRRAREVGVRKLNGATRKSVFLQFSIESLVLSLLSLGFGIGLFLMLRGPFIQLLPRAESMVKLQLTAPLVGWFLLFATFTGLLAGVAPSLFFAKLSSLRALRAGKMLQVLSGISLRKTFIVIQFTLSIIFVLAVVITKRQYEFSLNYDMGFDKENILNVELQGNDPKLLKTTLLQLPEVAEVSFSSYIPGLGTWDYLQLVDERNDDSVYVHQMYVDASYLTNMGIELTAGRNFRPDENPSRESSIIVNETFVRNFGLSNSTEALGTVFQLDGRSVEIIGVVKDFIYANLEEPINSFVFRPIDHYRYANVKVASNDILGTLDRVDASWNTLDPNHRMQARFLDDHIEGYYVFLVDFMKIFGFIGFLAISISSLGLFGMALYVSETRLKEIGIRKTFGATELGLIYQLSKGFLKMILLAIAIGTPICYLLFDRVILEEQVYRVTIGVSEIAISIFFLLALCLLTIVSQTWSAARRNPAVVLRNE